MKSDDVNKSIQDMTTNKMRERTKALAEQAGFVVWDGAVDWSCNYDDELERFAELVRADKREWVGLTPTEFNSIKETATTIGYAVIKTVAMLKKKNSG